MTFRFDMTPTQRSLEKLRREGWLVAVVEKWNAHIKIRQDLWGFGDLLAIRGNDVMIVQTTSGSNVSARVKKIEENEHAQAWASGLNRNIVVHGWRKAGERGKRKLWECREVEIDFSP